jgi:hypothetical protein
MGKLQRIAPRIGTLSNRVPPAPKQADDHYSSPEHKAWRTTVLKKAGYRCQHPGCTKGAPEHRLFADHIAEIRDGGARLDPNNGQALCGQHHTAKTARERAKRR